MANRGSFKGEKTINEKMKKFLFLTYILIYMPLHARDDDFRFYQQPPRPPENRYVQFSKDVLEGGLKGDFIEKPTIPNTVGNFLINLTPAYFVANLRDFGANFLKSFDTGFKQYKAPTVLCAAGFIPILAEGKNIKAIATAAKEARALQIAERAFKFAPALESGLTKKLQAALIENIREGEFIAVRARPYKANFLDGKYIPKFPDASVDKAFKNGARLLNDGRKAVSDLDLAFVVKNGRAVIEDKAMEYGKKVNESYGHMVVTHGDNFNGVKKGIEKAIEIEKKNEPVWIFGKDGFIDAGDYQSMVKRYVRK